MSTARIVHTLDGLLDRQATCLKSGDLPSAFKVAAAIEKLLDRLEAAPEPEPRVRMLKASAARNADLIQAAQRGVEAARALIEQSGQDDGFQSYDAQGRSTRIGHGL
ncbi:MAG: hypothetical protein AAFV38_05025 [Pseudomonadota bacterium]